MQIKESFASIAGSFTKTLVVSEVSAFVVALLPAWAIIGIIVVAVADCAAIRTEVPSPANN